MTIWNPHAVKYIESIEGVQRRATKMVPELKILSYPERLRCLRLPTMAYRRAWGDMIEVYKIVKEIYDIKKIQAIYSGAQPEFGRGEARIIFFRFGNLHVAKLC